MEQNFYKQALAYTLGCEVADLDVLLKFDTELGKEVTDLEFVLESHSSLRKIVYVLMNAVKTDITSEAQDILNDRLEDTTKEEIFADNDIQVLDSKKLLDKIGYILCTMPNEVKFLFYTELDNIVDFDLSVRDNAINLIKYLVKEM